MDHGKKETCRTVKEIQTSFFIRAFRYLVWGHCIELCTHQHSQTMTNIMTSARFRLGPLQRLTQ